MVCEAPPYAFAPVHTHGARADWPDSHRQSGDYMMFDAGMAAVAPLQQEKQADLSNGLAGSNPPLLVWVMPHSGDPTVAKAPLIQSAVNQVKSFPEVRSDAPISIWPQPKPSASALRRRRRQRAGLLASRTGEELVVNQRDDDIATLPEALEAGGEAREHALLSMQGRVEALAFSAAGCRAVQLALDVADGRTAAALAAELRGHVQRAVRSPHANYVLQKVILALPTAQSSFIAEELRGGGARMACHRFGCRIFCRLLEHCTSSAATEALVDEALAEAQALCCHAFGHYVAQAVLEHGLPGQQQAVAKALLADVPVYARHHSACHVLVDMVSSCSATERRAIVDSLITVPDLASLAQDKFGSKVLQAVLALPRLESKGLVCRLWAVMEQLRETEHGRKLAEKLGL
mmetsp:Transcript_59435/g.138443  ORF Transcript_59435/g.138443 Transcript_59435/m.138443 type:complete len:405 (-) Transcript_59435:260-1474(-)